MILTPIAPDSLDKVLNAFARALGEDALAGAAWHGILASRRAIGGDEARWHRDAVALAEAFGMRPIAQTPQSACSWDGASVRVLTEPAVLLHEVAHFQLASPHRRRLPDFGLGAGPETGETARAEAARCLGDAARETEEQRASLLGILWEVALGQPGILAFQEQNWLEGAGRASTAEFFKSVLNDLRAEGLIDGTGRPRRVLRRRADAQDAGFNAAARRALAVMPAQSPAAIAS